MHAIVVGTGANWKKEFNSAYQEGMEVIAVNRAIKDLPVDEDYAISNHPEFCAKTIDLIVPQQGELEDWKYATSGFLGVGLAVEKGFTKIYIAGMPLDHISYDKVVLRNFILAKKDILKDKLVLPEHYWWAELLGTETYACE